ncbi:MULTISPECIES: cytochrome aa3 quinol oxidase subunit II [Paenibacillus]|jgi:cytochrome aa3-600 menaquinol oxidase subunit 2|uniref:Quinol oxidase subunit 2 n=1 Tax=Paenibacillus glucanolyticus TaxID=59843 RepID=A0A163GA98_9BACL|nr:MULTISPECIES: cytochrome aa3 quinol oxidase subunit II [Paenibacillus]MCA4754130.1 cytochrome aa3 quinol oxidase subunit II [Mycolicibacterium fortuitum]ETT40508.1 cytochrome aa3 quinol oxidase subunit II [Paenibacillus sp. FSL R5-808]KZS44817.1 cytochrome aa3 quinol oxidase subunit II [Paenibacillus glucanolyticus]MDH6675019.1 cytochrome aa3-600 menaquinol oxidase subunit 2 [Paenibacillus sp. LBL]MEC0254827.1 cytochrome aa3 quinol oxidase subunit II [Paenibacillus lautus]
MKIKWAMLSLVFIFATVLTGCEPLKVLDPKGPQARTTADVIMISIWTMAIVVVVVIALYVLIIRKYRASKQSDEYEPPHIEGSLKLEILWTSIPILIVAFLSFVTVKSTYEVEAIPKGYTEEPLVIYASSSNWKWHFSYPEEDIETLNYLFIPTDRPIQFKLYSYGPISSFWIPQLGGQKYAMADMVNTLNLAADVPGEYTGRNANFSGEGFAQQTFSVKALSPEEYDEWVNEVKATANPLTEEKFKELLEPGHLGQSTFTGTHLGFSPPPAGHHPSTKETDAEGDSPTEEKGEENPDENNMSNMNH